MRRLARLSALICFATFGVGIGISRVFAADPIDGAAVSEGKKLFEREWEAGKPLSPGGDGLGPMFNARSCAACHKLGGIGGAGPVEDSNVRLLAIVPTEAHPSELKEHKATLAQVHPSFVPDGKRVRSAFIFHRFSTNAGYASLEKLALEKYPQSSPPDWQFRLGHRNTPALFGSGLIDAITKETLIELAAKQVKDDRVTGRVPPGPKGLAAGDVGRFGWRGQVPTLKEFVLGACANELGLEVPAHHQAADPLNSLTEGAQPAEKNPAPKLDMDEAAATQLVAFVASLPPPKRIVPDDPAEAKLAEKGYTLFNSLGCADCHVENVGPAKGIFSDLLLHDLGPRLADPVAAVSARKTFGKSKRPVPAEEEEEVLDPYVNTGPALKLLQQEWRTPPLWGLRASGPYLHDGRAATVKEAILLHAGESILSVDRFGKLPEEDQQAVLAFLNTLTAP